MQWLQDTVEKREEVLQRVMLSEDDYSESEISEFDVFNEANDMEEGTGACMIMTVETIMPEVKEVRKRAPTTAMSKVRNTQ